MVFEHRSLRNERYRELELHKLVLEARPDTTAPGTPRSRTAAAAARPAGKPADRAGDRIEVAEGRWQVVVGSRVDAESDGPPVTDRRGWG